MRKFFLVPIVFCCAILTNCGREPGDPEQPVKPERVEIMGGAIIINNYPDVNIVKKAEFPEGSETSTMTSGRLRKSVDDEQPPESLRANDYRFKLVAQMSTLSLERDGTYYEAQASHVKILDSGNDGYAFVAYNYQHRPNIGGLVVYRYVISGDQSLETVSVNVTAVTSIEMPNSQINAIDVEGHKLYIAGATDRRSSFGFREEDPAFFVVMELDGDMKFKPVEPEAVKQLTSFQATSIRYYNGRVYITTGDGTKGTEGGLYIYDENGYTLVKTILGLEHARSVDVDENGIYLMQSNDARVTKFALDGSGANPIYSESGRATQRDAKSEILAWTDYVFVSENESGLTMLSKDGQVYRRLAAPNRDKEDCIGSDIDSFECWYCEEDVTNSVSMNSDAKKAFDLRGIPYTVNSDLLFLANGRQGLYWYDIAQDTDGNDWIVGNSVNSILKGAGSSNFVESRGNIVFVADGLGGLKVLYIGFNTGDAPPGLVAGDGCMDFMPYLFGGTNITPLFPESQSVFRSNANDIVKTLFQLPSRAAAAEATLNYLKIKNDQTPLYISYMFEGAGWNNALGYFVIPAGVPETDAAEYQYYVQTIRPDLTTQTGSGANRVNVLKDEYTIFKYIRDVNPVHSNPVRGQMVPGNTYQIGGEGKTFQAGDRVVLFMCPDGFNSQNNRVEVTFDPGTNGNVKQIFFMHKYFNIQTNIRYASGYGDFAGIQFVSFYSANCESTVLCIEDIHTQHQSLDLDFNDVIFSISDNLTHDPVSGVEPPKWTVGERYDNPGQLEIILTEEHLGK